MAKIKVLLPTEDEEQTKFVVWLEKLGYRVAAVPNGGKRTMWESMRLKRTGLKKGFPDLIIPLPCGPYHGMFVEMKRQKGGVVTAEQANWLQYLREKGYYAVLAKGFEEAKELFTHYLTFMPKAA